MTGRYEGKESKKDLHEKNIIIDNKNEIKIIDPDSFIINNERLCVNGEYLIGKYVNHYYNNEELKKINRSADYYSLLCLILKYAFKDITKDISDPVSFLKQDEQFKELHSFLDKVDINFVLSEKDINNIFNFKNNLNYIPIDNIVLEKEIKRVRRLLNKKES